MAKYLRMQETNHSFDKVNAVTQFDGEGQYDTFRCEYCGLTGKRRSFSDELELDGRVSEAKLTECPKAPPAPEVKKIRVTECLAFGPEFEGLEPDSVHDVVPVPAQHAANDKKRPGIWVMGKTEPVKLLANEYEVVE